MINLKKGNTAPIDNLKFTVGLGWEPNNSAPIDLDLSVFMLNQNKLLPSDAFFVFYGNDTSEDKSITHSGDDRTGKSSAGGDDETVNIDLSLIDPRIKEILFLVSINDATIDNLSFGKVKNSYIRILDSSNTEIIRYDLNEDFIIEKSIIFGKLVLINNVWQFQAVGHGFTEELDYHVSQYYTGLVTK